ncbi:hypothetical protein AYO20_04308 [Fonsecaea nubica]|uniref:Prolyl 4-hydroxylase alpha subunit Fe(2+) 2OG dioxygenase domain-containing protein n=1 Tax=Fonsecaea nubica TaxID=856822 RepID=A0A178D4C5_9EURO|nr:hypothetical protein AYO20_04308 [Fonsecaea nubica]OAL36412.1 hypothetical protein AYO20_04308 [Fonsecaea nubica]
MSSEDGYEYGSDEEQEQEQPYGPLRSQIRGCLRGIHSSGSFATSDHNVEHILPGLTVKGVGPIRLPLSREDASALIRVSRQAPFGKGGETLVDETVRKTWEIDGKELSFENKGWNAWLEQILEHVSSGLGIPGGAGSVQAELYKLLVYEEGAFFKPHKDTEKTKNMFGTLVVCLPSERTGGAVRLIHGEEETILETDKWSSYGVSYLAWYSDVSHEILPVKSGCRFVLTYNLINATVPRQLSAAVLDVEQSKIDGVLTEWYSMQDQPQFLCYVLEHKYTGAGLQLSCLKGDDYYRCSQLERACQSNGRFCLFLSRLQLTVSRSNDEEYEQEGNEELCLNDVVTLQGTKLQDSLKISDDLIVQQSVYANRDRDEQWGGEHLGNQHAEIVQAYHDAVIVIVRRDQMTKFLLGSGYKVEHYSKFLDRLFVNLKGQNNGEHCLFREIIEQTCNRHLKMRYKNSRQKDGFLGPTAIELLRIDNLELANTALDAVEESFDRSTFWNLAMLGFDKTKDFSAKDFSRISKLHLVDRGLRAFRSGVRSGSAEPDSQERLESAVHQWAVDTLCKALNSITEVLPQDAGAVVQIMDTYGDTKLWKCMDTFLGRFVDETAFVSALFVETLCYVQTAQKSDVVEHLLSPIFDAAISSFQLHQFSSYRKSRLQRENYPFSSWPESSWSIRDKLSKKDVAVVVSLYRRLAGEDLTKAGQLLEKIANDTATIQQDDLDRFIIPLLQELIDITKLQPLEASLFYAKAIPTYIERVVEKEPPKPHNWSLPDDIAKCDWTDCPHCSVVREFLENPSEKERCFTIPKDQDSRFCWHFPHHYNRNEDESGQDLTIKVTKSLKTWEDKHKEWRRRADNAQSKLQSLPEMPLRECLGNTEYQDLIKLRIVKLSAEDVSQGPPDSAEANPAPVTPGGSADAEMKGRKRRRI